MSEIQDTIPRVMNYFWKDLLQKKVNLVLHRENSCDAVQNSERRLSFSPNLKIGHEIGTSL